MGDRMATVTVLCLSPCSEDAPGDPNRMKLLEALLGEAGLQEPSMQDKDAR